MKLAGLARSTFYYQQSSRLLPDKYAALKSLIQSTYDVNKGRYGYRRIAATVRRAGHKVSHTTVQRLMGEMGLKSRVRLKRFTSYRGDAGKTVANLMKRDFKAEQPNQKWVTDVTEFKVKGEKLYLSPVLDLYNGEIVAYQTAKRPQFVMVTDMLEKAFKRLTEGDSPMLHSDQGWQYRMPSYQHLLRENDVEQSMSRKGNCLDNATMESFFGTLKSEYFYLERFDSVDQLEAGLDDYIRYYNHDRIKLKLGGMSPVEYRAQAEMV